jgi:N-terminal domain of toast_rack, DUF2154/LiaI-LiaF-like transmembrane region
MPGNRRSSLVGAFLLIALGLLFLYSNFRPGLDPWPLLSRYWPVLLVFLGLGKLWDQFGSQDGARKGWLSGREIAVILLLVIFGIALSFSGASRRVHDIETVERQGSEPVRVHVQMPAGDLKLSGGASKLLEADFKYAESEGKPKVSYQASTLGGQLEITQVGKKFNFGRTENRWDLRLGNNIPMELNIDMGAGQSEVKVGDLALSRLEMNLGAGQITADLTGDWKKDLEADIRGGVGNAVILLPEDVGVRVHATGGIGSISGGGLKREGDEYTNDLYGKSPVTLRLDISGGVGNIELQPTSVKGKSSF